MSLLSEIIKLLLTMMPHERTMYIREDTPPPYEVS
jgi:hypothetical protein